MAEKKGSRIGLWIIMGLLFIGLLGFGSAGLNGGIRTVGIVGDKEISYSAYANGLTDRINGVSQQLGSPLTFADAQTFRIPEAVLNQLIAQRTLDNEAALLGLSSGDQMVFDQVQNIPAFRGLDGNFDRDAYRLTLQNRGQTEEDFETELRESTARTLLQAAVATGVPEGDVYANALAQFIGERRSFSFAVLDETILEGETPELSDEDIATYFDANRAIYTSPETRHITYAWITPEMLRDTVEVEDSQVRALYDERIDQFVQPERRLVERLVYPDEDAANAALDRIESDGAVFEDLVEARGLELADADMGDVGPEDLGAATEAVFAAQPGDVIGPIMTSLGPAIFRMNAVLIAQETSFEDAAPDLRAELAEARARRIIRDNADPMTDLIAGGAAIADIVERTDLVQAEIDWHPGLSEGIAAYDTFRAAAAAAEDGDFLELFELSDGGLFVLQLDSITAEAELPFEDVADDVTADAQAEALQQAIIDRTTELVTQLATDGDFEALGLTATTEENRIRRDVVAGTPEGFVTEIFAIAAEGDVITRPFENGTIIARLDSIAPADLEDETIAADRETIARDASQSIAQDMFQIFAAEVQSRTDIDIDDGAIAAINSQFR